MKISEKIKLLVSELRRLIYLVSDEDVEIIHQLLQSVGEGGL